MIYGIGSDITETARIKEVIEKYGDRFLGRIYTETEIKYCDSFNDTRHVHYAARFAAKESFSKAIGTGITKGFKFKEFGIENEPSGKPNCVLSGGALEKYGHLKFHVSLSHTDNNAVAFIVLEQL